MDNRNGMNEFIPTKEHERQRYTREREREGIDRYIIS